MMNFSVYIAKMMRKFIARRSRVIVSIGLISVVFGLLGYLGLRPFIVRPMVQAAITTEAPGTTLNYAGIAITVQTLQRSDNFIDDPVSASDGMLRLHLQLRNQRTGSVNMSYSQVMRVVLPGGQVVEPMYVKADSRLRVGVPQRGLLDFAVVSNIKTSRLILRIGNADEAQMDMPLFAHANLSSYQPRTVILQQQMQYLGLNWNLSQAQIQWSLNNQQAAAGRLYAIITLKVDNPLSQVVIAGSAYNYIHLRTLVAATEVPGIEAELIDSQLPVAFEASVKGATGTITFLIPQNTRNFRLILGDVNQNLDGFQSATADIQL